jgi:diguanylate cyclase (GGDEF)-like protein
VIAVTQLEPAVQTARTEPYFWLIAALAVLAGSLAIAVRAPGGKTVFVSPTVCFTFATLLGWGLGPAIVSSVGAMAAVALRNRLTVRAAAMACGEFVIAFAVADVVLVITDPQPMDGGPALHGAVATLAAMAAWLGAYTVLVMLAAWLRADGARPRRVVGLAGYEVLFRSALLLLSPMLVASAYDLEEPFTLERVNIVFVLALLVPLYAVQRMARLSVERLHAARLDPLSGLPNRAGLSARFDDLRGGRAERWLANSNGRSALMVLDLDRFTWVNDALGYDVGDRLLKAVAARLCDAAPADAVVARLGGDEFGLLARVSDIDEARGVAGHFLRTLSDPVVLDGLSLDVTASVGIAVDHGHADDFATMLRHADFAMYEAKRRGDSTTVYEPQADHSKVERLSLLTDFRRALEGNADTQIDLHYQPQVSLQSGEVVGVEALLRWKHPVRGPVEPREVLQVAEHTSVMRLLTNRVIDRVVAQVASWNSEGIKLRASLNVSARDLYDVDIVRHLASQLATHSVPAGQIQLEITESALMTEPDRALVTTRRLADLGVGVALDDYGTGYSSLQRLRRLPPSELKIDRSFVSGMATNSEDAAIVASTVDMAKSLGLRTVGEGVDNELTRTLLADLGCTLAQGWLTGRPMPGHEIPAWLDQQTPPDVAENTPTGR